MVFLYHGKFHETSFPFSSSKNTDPFSTGPVFLYADAGAALRGRGRFDSGNRRQAVIRVMGWRLPGARRVKKAEMPGQCRACKNSARFGGLCVYPKEAMAWPIRAMQTELCAEITAPASKPWVASAVYAGDGLDQFITTNHRTPCIRFHL